MSPSIVPSKAANGSARPTSPEQLDQLMTITSPAGWVSLLATLAMLLTAVLWSFWGSIPITATGPGILLPSGGLRTVSNVVAGRVVDLVVREGDVVEQGQVIAHIQPLDQFPNTAIVDITSPFPGRVVRLAARPGAVINTGDPVLTLGPLEAELEGLLYLPLDKGKKVAVGQSVQLTVSTVDRQEYGFLYGVVKRVGHYSTTEQQMREALGSDNLVKLFLGGADPFQAAPVRVDVRLLADLGTPTGYRWSSQSGPPFALQDGTVCTAEIVTGTEHPVDLVVPYLLKRFGASPE